MKKILCFGEALLRLQSENSDFFGDNHRLKVYPGGSEANVAARLAAMGEECSFLSAAPDNELTRDYLRVLNDRGVDTSSFIFSSDRMGSYYLLSANGLTKGEVIYDRKYSAFDQLKKGDVYWEKILNGYDWLHWTALTPALGEGSVVLIKEALQVADSMGIGISADLNYRNKLWQYGKAPHEVMPDLVQYCDLILGNVWASQKMLETFEVPDFNSETPPEECADFSMSVARQLFYKFPKAKLIANTFRFSKDPKHNRLFGTAHTHFENALSKTLETFEVVDRIGSGDAFMAGIIKAYLDKKNLQEIVNSGVKEGFDKLFKEGDF